MNAECHERQLEQSGAAAVFRGFADAEFGRAADFEEAFLAEGLRFNTAIRQGPWETRRQGGKDFAAVSAFAASTGGRRVVGGAIRGLWGGRWLLCWR